MTIELKPCEHQILECTLKDDFTEDDAVKGHEALKELLGKDEKVHILVDISQCTGITLRGAVKDAMLNTRYALSIAGVALVEKKDHHSWIKTTMSLGSKLLGYHYRVFADNEVDEARKWLHEIAKK